MVLFNGDGRSYTRDQLEVLNSLVHPVWIFDSERLEMFWANKAGLALWNAESLDALLSRDYKSDMSESTRLRVARTLARLKEHNAVVHEQWTYYPKGVATTCQMTESAIRITTDDDGKGGATSGTDTGRIMNLCEAELPNKEAIQERSVRSTEMLRHLPLPVCEFSIKGKLMYQNPAALSMFGAVEPEPNAGSLPAEPPATATAATDSSTTAAAAIPEAPALDDFVRRFVDRHLGESALKQVQSGNDYYVETELYTQEGSRWASVNLRRTRDPVTSDFVILYSARDITEIVQARQETTRANLKSEFIAVIAHEIRTPLHQIVGFLDLLALTQLSSEQRNTIEEVQSSTALLMSIINDLLDYSKLECGKLLLESMPFGLEGVIKGCIAATEPDADKKGLVLRSNIATILPSKFVGDPNRLRQILLNLLSNAVKFTSSGSVTLTVGADTRASDAYGLRFEVADTGIGIDPSVHEAVFQKYRQANASVARNYGGTGLGLVIVKELTQLMGGEVKIESEVDKGTTVCVEIPFKLPSATPKSTEKAAASKPTAPQSKGLNLLVAEDNKINQKVARSMLHRIGHTATIAENGQLALDELRKQSFDLILMDIQMPVMDGIECTKQIRTTLGHSKQDLPIVGLTASFQHSDMEYYLDVGMNDCLGKPLRLEKLREAITTAVTQFDGAERKLPTPHAATSTLESATAALTDTATVSTSKPRARVIEAAPPSEVRPQKKQRPGDDT